MEDNMKLKKEQLTEVSATLALALSILSGGAVQVQAQTAPASESKVAPNMPTTEFYCNTKALDPAERASHRQLGEKLMGARKKIVETEKGYEFQFSPSDVSLDELAQWVKAEAKCCPFFNFHIDLEEKGSLLCLGLTGQSGIKAFIRSEFELSMK
jgi:hypothetical protein